MKVFLAIAKANAPVTTKEIAAWINKTWSGEEPVSANYIGNVLLKMREEDKKHHSDKLLDTEGKKSIRYKLGKYAVKTTPSAEMLIKLNETFCQNERFLSHEDERQIIDGIGLKYNIPNTTLAERLDKAIKGKYLSRGEDGLLKALERITAEIDLLKALTDFDADIQGEKRTPPGEQESNVPSLKSFPEGTKKS